VLLKGKLLYVDEAREDQPLLKKDLRGVAKVAELKRKRGPLLIENIELDVLEGPKGGRVRSRGAPGIGEVERAPDAAQRAVLHGVVRCRAGAVTNSGAWVRSRLCGAA